MADYRDLAAALGGGYGQDTGGITPDTLATLRNGKNRKRIRPAWNAESHWLGIVKQP
jgi:hypothetical protein